MCTPGFLCRFRSKPRKDHGTHHPEADTREHNNTNLATSSGDKVVTATPSQETPIKDYEIVANIGPTMIDLEDAVVKAMKRNCLSTGEFLPCDRLEAFVNRNNVTTIIGRATNTHTSYREDLIKFALNDGKRLFLILVLVTKDHDKLCSLLGNLLSQKISDKLLPIDFQIDETQQGSYYYGTTAEGNEQKRFDFFHLWQRHDRDLFDTYQWKFLAPVFGNGVFHFNLHPKIILPYLRQETQSTSSGFFGEVSKVEMHKAHVPNLIADPTTDKVAIAIKKARHDEQLAEFFDKEARNLRALREYKSPHLIKPIAAYQMNQDRCLIFPWANGGNLKNYWEKFQDKRSDHESLQWILGQFKGLFSALQELHESNCRHGDLKPENILWFQDEHDLGTLQIADLGLATFHEKEKDTKARKDINTMTPSGTSRYEPPEMDSTREEPGARSRQYDMWSMGCVTLELLIWIVYGYDAVKTFIKSTDHFWVAGSRPVDAPSSPYRVHPYVVSCMKVMMTQLDDQSALKDLLGLVEKRLLVVDVSVEYGSSPAHREIAAVFCSQMAQIEQKCQSTPSYITPINLPYPSDKIRAQQSLIPSRSGGLEAPPRPDVPSRPVLQLPPSDDKDLPDQAIVRRATGDLHSNSLETNASSNAEQQNVSITRVVHVAIKAVRTEAKQDHPDDNEFAAHFFGIVDWNTMKPAPRTAALCSDCSTMDPTALLNGEYTLLDLRVKSNTCDLCHLLLEALESAGVGLSSVISLRRNGSTVGIKNGHNLLSLYSEPGSSNPYTTQLGLPELPQARSAAQFELLKQWIRKCDAEHEICHRKDDENCTEMPTRLLEVKDTIRLVDSASIESSRYVALSHCWGSLRNDEKLCATRDNIEKLRTCINFERLPWTFRDAVTVTRGLGMDYIWIDSLCIIQDDSEDWKYEAARMEQVFRGAYFTIAATSATTSNDAFLTFRPPRSCVELVMPNGEIVYVCRFIDNFHEDVELGALNRRGWVLQERVLSRRSIHFSSNQIYWECGLGVHCETLTRLHNSKAAFLGDANFPISALEYYRDGRQMLLQDLYERYSGLAFTVPSDRSVAILGLERRLARTFKTKATYGLFAVYFGRGLLWQRRSPQRMNHIVWKNTQPVPSWSWFSKEGPIKYMELEFEKIEWATQDFDGPFSRRGRTSRLPSASMSDRIVGAFKAPARKLVLTDFELLVRVTFDAEDEFNREDLRCVVVGRDKSDDGGSQLRSHAIIIHPSDVLGEGTYKRVGVASLMSLHLGNEISWVTVR